MKIKVLYLFCNNIFSIIYFPSVQNVLRKTRLEEITDCFLKNHAIVAKREIFEIFRPVFNDRKLLYF